MRIVVCVKDVPDTNAARALRNDDNTLDRAGADSVMNEIDEYAVEEALRIKEAHGGDVTVVTMGPAGAGETLRKAMSMGADRAVHLQDEALHGSDVIQTSVGLAAAIRTTDYDLVILGAESTDARMSVMGALLAEQLALPQLTLANKVTVENTSVTVERHTDTSIEVLTAPLPAVVSVLEKINEPRYPSFKGIMAAKSRPVVTVSADEVGLAPDTLGLTGAGTKVTSVTARPPRAAGLRVLDDGDGGRHIVDFLASHKHI